MAQRSPRARRTQRRIAKPTPKKIAPAMVTARWSGRSTAKISTTLPRQKPRNTIVRATAVQWGRRAATFRSFRQISTPRCSRQTAAKARKAYRYMLADFGSVILDFGLNDDQF